MLHVLSTALFDRPAFKNVISHGIVLGSDGQKMSKSLRNYPDVSEVFDRDGADAMRWFLMSSLGHPRRQPRRHRGGHPRGGAPVPAAAVEHVLFLHAVCQRRLSPEEQPTKEARLEAGYEATWRTDSDDVLDRYLLAKTRHLIHDVTADLEALDSPLAAAKLRDFADVLTNWYVRRSRDRFWDGDDRDASTRCTPCWKQ